MVQILREGRCGPSQTGLSVRTYRALAGRGLLRCTSGSGNASKWELTDDGRAWSIENV
jgi:hypothetical protein